MAFITVDSSRLYALAFSGLFIILFVVALFHPLFLRFSKPVAVFINRALFYTPLLHRHRFFGPWTTAEFVVQSGYVIANLVSISFNASSVSMASLCAGRLALFNMIPLFLSPDLAFLADSLGLPLRVFRKVHCSSGVMTMMMTLVHVCLMAFQKRAQDLYTLLAGAFLPNRLTYFTHLSRLLRKMLYEGFLRIHQALAIFAASLICRHLLAVPDFSWLYLYVYASVACCLNIFYLALTLYRNVARGKPFPRASLKSQGGGTTIIVDLPRPVHIDAGQYVNLWIWAPKISFWTCMQSHPFTVASWSPDGQVRLELFAKSRRGLTSKMTGTPQTDTSNVPWLKCLAFFSGPHGSRIDISDYKSAIMVASDYGIVAMLPFLQKFVYGYKFFTGRICRIHIIWHIKTSGLPAIQHILNQYLGDAELRSVLQLSVFKESDTRMNWVGSHGRLSVLNEAPTISEIFLEEINGDFVTHSDQDESSQQVDKFIANPAKLLLRDRVRKEVRKHLYEDMELRELDYQIQ
ncbi:hypothetical protein B0I35DRAFT_363151 [Stachybotrys elegans]|uniref:FAD-binding 8 domain-containing protein n=1 Tax=Stachybotrys elegans TaxID=80388 RepID=A0A8K0SAC4_9HYPO|nr:hypothetical protein B0I35DRAFT_363151 [Stachybotrys elegans]